MSKIRQKFVAGLICLIGLYNIGCGGPPPQTGGSASPTTQALNRQVQEMDTEIKRLQGEISILKIEKTELLKRADALQAETSTLKFLNEQMDKQLSSLAGVPTERDKYKEQIKKLAVETLELRMRAERLEKVLDAIQAGAAATQPATTQSTSQSHQP